MQAVSGDRVPQDSDNIAGCPLYAMVREKDNNMDFDLCQRLERQGHLFTSKTNEVEIYFTSLKAPLVTPKYMLQYTGNGHLTQCLKSKWHCEVQAKQFIEKRNESSAR